LRNRGSGHKRQSVAVCSQSHTLKFANDDLKKEVEKMPGKKKKLNRLLKKLEKQSEKALRKAPEL